MNILLDTNILSEVRRPEPELAVLDWLAQLDEDRAFISVISLAEIRRGITLLDEGRRRTALADWLANELTERFSGRILPVDPQVAISWGDLMAVSKRKGMSIASMDGLIAATAVTHNLALATRNVKDFQFLDLQIINPWIGS
ncbi:MAG: type II toxin-antitoxin system VapC family toxin [Pyrinomonadaceae bacterium]